MCICNITLLNRYVKIFFHNSRLISIFSDFTREEKTNNVSLRCQYKYYYKSSQQNFPKLKNNENNLKFKTFKINSHLMI